MRARAEREALGHTRYFVAPKIEDEAQALWAHTVPARSSVNIEHVSLVRCLCGARERTIKCYRVTV